MKITNTERDTLLLTTLMDLVPDSTKLSGVIEDLKTEYNLGREILTMLQGYGTLLNVIQAAIEVDDAGDLHARLSYAYYELTNQDPGAADTQIRLPEED